MIPAVMTRLELDTKATRKDFVAQGTGQEDPRLVDAKDS